MLIWFSRQRDFRPTGEDPVPSPVHNPGDLLLVAGGKILDIQISPRPSTGHLDSGGGADTFDGGYPAQEVSCAGAIRPIAAQGLELNDRGDEIQHFWQRSMSVCTPSVYSSISHPIRLTQQPPFGPSNSHSILDTPDRASLLGMEEGIRLAHVTGKANRE